MVHLILNYYCENVFFHIWCGGLRAIKFNICPGDPWVCNGRGRRRCVPRRWLLGPPNRYLHHHGRSPCSAILLGHH